jgi:hypothetical protein
MLQEGAVGTQARGVGLIDRQPEISIQGRGGGGQGIG